MEDEWGENEEWTVKGIRYEILQQQRYPSESWSIRRTPSGEMAEWLKHPSEEYETMAGARYAILLDLAD